MVSSHTKRSAAAYPKAVADRKGVAGTWPVGRDTPDEAAFKVQYARLGMTAAVVSRFRLLVYAFAAEQGRDLPWRRASDPWRVLVSEVMLQQTQVERVIPKYTAFLERFPGPTALAAAPIPELLEAWQGLGYNRRALNLQRAAQQVVTQWDGRLPDDPAQLQQLPGIGPYTAGAIAAFAFSRPTIFLETNIRAVLLHLFCGDRHDVPDKELLVLAEQVLDHDRPRDWYNALMDYGSDLKRRFPNPSRRSRHHSVQSRFEGSDRQVRGALLRLLLNTNGLTVGAIRQALAAEPDRLQRILEGMVKEGFLQQRGSRYLIPPV